MEERHLTVARTARYYLLGDTLAPPDELWVAIHGYGQLAGRFARAFEPLSRRRGRLVAVPEALSRFYVDAPAAASHSSARVGATWMTREDREHEIADYVAYLDALATSVTRELGGDRPPRRCVFGFSQGVATAARWAWRGASVPDRLILWGGTLPAELDAAAGARLATVGEVTIVSGTRDPLTRPEMLASEVERLGALGVRCRLVTFDGAHELHAATLDELVGR